MAQVLGCRVSRNDYLRIFFVLLCRHVFARVVMAVAVRVSSVTYDSELFSFSRFGVHMVHHHPAMMTFFSSNFFITGGWYSGEKGVVSHPGHDMICDLGCYHPGEGKAESFRENKTTSPRNSILNGFSDKNRCLWVWCRISVKT